MKLEKNKYKKAFKTKEITFDGKSFTKLFSFWLKYKVKPRMSNLLRINYFN